MAPSLRAIWSRVTRLDSMSSADNPVNMPVSSTPISYIASPWPSLSRHFSWNQRRVFELGVWRNVIAVPRVRIWFTWVTRCSKRNLDGLISLSLYSTLPIWGSGGSRVASSSCSGHTSQLAERLVPGSNRSKNESIARPRRWYWALVSYSTAATVGRSFSDDGLVRGCCG